MKNLLILVITLAFISSCDRKSIKLVETIPLGNDIELIEELAEMTNPCRDSENYIPDSKHLKHTSLKQVKVNVHVIQNAEGKGNLSGANGRKYIKEILASANQNLRTNNTMALPVGNNTEVISARYLMKLWPTSYIPGDDGIYFHQDEEFYYNINRGKNKNIYDSKIFTKFGIQKDTVLNIIVQDVHLDSLKSENFDPKSNGVAFRTWVKVANWYHAVRDTIYKNGEIRLPKKYMPPKLLNHEIGHVFNLRHAWRKDLCEDTPEHANCWISTGAPPCKVVSNNIMDYNSTMSALTPCQLGRVHMSMLTNETKRALLVKDWCILNTYKGITVEEDITWNCMKTIQGKITIKDGARLVIRCETSLPNDGEIIIQPGGELVLQGARLYNDCDGQWNGIVILKEGKKSGKVTYIGQNTKIENCKHPIELEREPKIKS